MRTESPVRGPNGCTSRAKTTGELCKGQAIEGLDRCRMHVGKSGAQARAEGAVVIELRNWGLTGHDELADPGVTLLRLVTQSAQRVELYSSLLAQAYDAAERLHGATVRDLDPADDELPGHADTGTDRERALLDLQRVFTTGGVGALIGVKWGAAGKDGELYQAEEAIRGLVGLEAAERERCAGFAAKAVAAGLAERQVRLAEQQAALVADAIRAVLTDLGHELSDPAVMAVVSTRLEALAVSA